MMHDGGVKKPRRTTGIALLLAAGLTVVGCSPSTVVAPDSSAPRTVNVSATGSADVAPDAARASLTVETNDPASAQAAQEAAAVATTEVLTALTAAGIDDADIATQAVNVGPTYDYTDAGQKLTGYRASQTLTVTLRDLATAGATLDSVVAAGGNAARVDSLVPFVTDPAAATAKARAQAVDVARAQAEQYATLLGFTLGPVASVSESSASAPLPPIAMADAAAPAPEKVPTPIEPGTTQVTVTLDISWSIAD